ncbi:FAD-binding monooxygenase-like protein [Cadophora sp. MPI-SDFR-AT-0126]|nr:FAD-binding monooxygenase-like protein [Leotiomycetes sp. MPI-SDFR-AT-0126]
MASNAHSIHIPVLIVGGGVVGLSASLFLNYHGIRTILVEKHSGTSIHPRSRGVNTRTMEFYRELSITTAIKEAGKSMSPTGGMKSAPTFYSAISPIPRSAPGKRTFRPTALKSILSTMSPEEGLFISLELLEPVLLNAACERDVDARFSTECLSVTQDGEKVTARLKRRESGEEYEITADYCIAADGASSPIREQLGIKRYGQNQNAGHLLNILFNADLGSFVRGREYSIIIIHNPGKPAKSGETPRPIDGGLTSINNAERWVFHLCYDPSKGEKAEDFPNERCEEIVRTALGMDESPEESERDVEVKIISVLPWQASVRVASRMREDRIFLAGDSAHQMPPYAGQGANSGIADVHNLAWKLAATLHSKSPSSFPHLLDTYEAERLPVDTYAAEVSGASANEKGLLYLKKDLRTAGSLVRRAFLVPGVSVTYEGQGVGIVPEDPGLLGGMSWKTWTFAGMVMGLDGRPGRRVPHVWLRKPVSLADKQGDGEEGKISTLDLCGRNFALLTGSEGRAWVKAAENVVASDSLAPALEIKTYVIGGSGADDYLPVETKAAFETAAGISSTGALLVRPDGIVAWRVRRPPSAYEERLEDVFQKLLRGR